MIAGYCFIYSKLIQEFNMLTPNDDEKQSADKEEKLNDLKKNNLETRKCFIFICQFMITYIIYMTLKLFVNEKHIGRLDDICDICLIFSHILMLYGIILSI